MTKKLCSMYFRLLLISLIFATVAPYQQFARAANAAPTPPTAFRSKDWRAVAEVFPPQSRQNSSEHPLCLLYSVAAPGAGWQAVANLQWKNELVNPDMPDGLLVLPDERIVTLNDVNRRGFENSLVIYDRKGQLVRSLPLADLIPKEEMPRIRHTESSREWSEGAQYFVTASPARLYVVLKWRGIVKVDLTNGNVDYGDVAKFPETIAFSGKPNSPEQVEVLPISLRFSSITDIHGARTDPKKQPALSAEHVLPN